MSGNTTIAGSVKDDRKWFYPDLTGFQFDTCPRNLAGGRANYDSTVDFRRYGGVYFDIPWNTDKDSASGTQRTWQDPKEHEVKKYNGWLNWMHKFEFDVRFAAVSDKNAYLYQFPEVEYPWKFTEYIFSGIGDDKIVIEPPLYNPEDLTICNGVENPEGFVKDGPLEFKRKVGKVSGDGYEENAYEPTYYYVCRYIEGTSKEDIKANKWKTGPRRKQHEPDVEIRRTTGDLETGLIVDGKRYHPWTDPVADGAYQNTFVKTGDICAIRKKFKYKTTNRGVYQYVDTEDENKIKRKSTGIRLYRVDIPAKCVDRGEHGNIPPYTINMSAPKDWLSPENMYRNVVVPVVTATVGQAMYNTDSGIIYYGNANNPTITIRLVNSWAAKDPPRMINGYSLPIFEPTEGDAKEQPKPQLGSKFQKMCRGAVADGITVGSYVGKGCSHFKGTKEGGCWCEVRRQLLEDYNLNPNDNPDDFAGLLGSTGSPAQTPEACTSYSTSPDSPPAVKEACRFYVEQGPREIFVFSAEGMSSDDYAEVTGYNDAVSSNMQGALEISGIPLAGAGMAGLSHYALARSAQTQENHAGTLGAMTTRYEVSYEFKRVDSAGREVVSDRAGRKSSADYDKIVTGTGKFAFDKYSTGYGGVDTDIFNGTNMMSRNRFCTSVMHCYNAEFCNKAYGPLKMSAGDTGRFFAGVDEEEEYCRYYSAGCPTTEIHHRAKEYDREYSRSLESILKVFREYGIDGFEGLNEERISDGVFVAKGGENALYDIESVEYSDGGRVFFMYTVGKDAAGHRLCDVFGFIRQYGPSQKGGKIPKNNFLKMSVSASFLSAPDGLPWLVKLEDDYVSPKKYESFATNLMSFFGGRMPEYKDYSKMGEEILCPVIQTIMGYDGALTSGKGGSSEYDDSQTSTTYTGYRVDKSGEWIIEGDDENGNGISVGNLVPPEQKKVRASLPPSIVNGARPIEGSFSRTSISSEKSRKARMTRAWVFSSDTRENIEETGKVPVTDGDGETTEISIAGIAGYCLPVERQYYYCPKCSPNPYAWTSEPNYYGEKPLKQIFTDFEYQQYGKCPRCASVGIETNLIRGGNWSYFPKCRSYGTVNYFGFPGEIVDGSGFFWKNHTEISRSFISEYRSKLGSPNVDGGGPQLNPASSVNGPAEGAVHKLGLADKRFHPDKVTGENKQRGSSIKSGWWTPERTQDGADPEYVPTYAENLQTKTDVKIAHQIWTPQHMKDSYQLDFQYDNTTQVFRSQYRDRYINPYRIKMNGTRTNDGLDFITANQLKNMRNMIEPAVGYPCFTLRYEELKMEKQVSKKNRFNYEQKKIKNELVGVSSFMLAANEMKNDANYVQFWDGTIFPGKTVRAYYPTSPIWWFRRDLVGGIRRSGGTSGVHFNDASQGLTGALFGYTGNLYTASFHSIQGWLPLDKEVVGAVLIMDGQRFPEEPMLGRVRDGGPFYDKHWHSFTPENWPAGQDAHDAADRDMIISLLTGDSAKTEGESPNNDASEGDYWPVLYESEQIPGGDDILAKYNDINFGWKTNQDFLEWGGFGEDLVQKYTEEEIWKKYTFNEFREKIDGLTYNITIEIGNPTRPESVQDVITVIPKDVADGLINNEGQAIPGMFNLSGLNTSLLISKYGMDFAEKKYNTDWAEGGHVVVQGKTFAQSSGSTPNNGSSGGSGSDIINGAVAGEGKSYVFDITRLIKSYYNDRVARAFEARGGVAYGDIWSYIQENKVNYKKDGILEGINNRNKPSGCEGYILTNSYIYPKLDKQGDFPNIEDGGEYEREPLDIVNLDYCGKFYSDTEEEDDSEAVYYKYGPHNLFMTGEDNMPTGVTWSMEEDKITYSLGGAASPCRPASYRSNELFFTVNVSGFPTETERRPYRFESGSWNVANAICPNTNCFVHQDGATVSEAQAASLSMGTGNYAKKSFQLTSTKCGACNTSLIGKPEETGAMYVGGDGIKTVYYRHMPEKDSIINGIQIQIPQVNLENNSFAVYSRSSSSTYWEQLFIARWLPKAKKWSIGEYNQAGSLIQKQVDTLPDFKGKWIDGYNLNEPSALNGYHFLACRANKIKVVFIPETHNEDGEELPNEGRKRSYTNLVEMGSSNIISSYALKNVFSGARDIEEGCVVEIFDTLDTDQDPIWQSQIQKYTEETKTITTVNALPQIPQTVPEGEEQDYYYYRINRSKYMATCTRFRVLGFEVSDYLTMTEDADSMVLPVPDGAASIMFYDKASKILSVRAVKNGASLYGLNDTGFSAPVTSNQLRYFVKYNNSLKKYQIVGGEFFYDTFKNAIYLPVYCCKYDDSSRSIVSDIDNVYNPLVVDQNTSPSALEIKYMSGNGKSIDLDITSVGEGPSYIIERDCIRCIYDPQRPGASSLGTSYNSYSGKSSWGSLPDMGKSVFLKRRMRRADLEWMVTNKERTEYTAPEWGLNGLELAGGISHSKMEDFVGGNDETLNGLEERTNSNNESEEVKRRLGGKSSGKITLTGLPNSIVSGILCMYAPSTIRKTVNYGGYDVTTYERTGGLRKTGFTMFPSDLVQSSGSPPGGSLACYAFNMPRVVVYLRERLLTEPI